MTNTPLLEEYIKKSGYRKAFIADQLGISAYGFAMKCSNKSEFKATEIEALSKLLNIGIRDRMAIFFAK